MFIVGFGPERLRYLGPTRSTPLVPPKVSTRPWHTVRRVNLWGASVDGSRALVVSSVRTWAARLLNRVF